MDPRAAGSYQRPVLTLLDFALYALADIHQKPCRLQDDSTCSMENICAYQSFPVTALMRDACSRDL